MNAAVAQLERLAAEVPSVKVVPEPAAAAPAARPARTSSRCSWTSTTPARSTSPSSCAQKVGIDGDQPGEMDNGKVRLYVIGQGALGAAATLATKHDIAAGREVEPADRPGGPAGGVRLAGGRGDAACCWGSAPSW